MDCIEHVVTLIAERHLPSVSVRDIRWVVHHPASGSAEHRHWASASRVCIFWTIDRKASSPTWGHLGVAGYKQLSVEVAAFRYTLTREWSAGEGRVVWVMLNPSTADDTDDDPTIRRCIRFSRDWGYQRLEVVNLFAVRATKPADIDRIELHTATGGPRADGAITEALNRCDLVVCAWGVVPPRLRGQQRDREVLDMIRAAGRGMRTWPHHLGLTKDGFPRHPLYLPADSSTQLWVEEMPQTAGQAAR